MHLGLEQLESLTQVADLVALAARRQPLLAIWLFGCQPLLTSQYRQGPVQPASGMYLHVLSTGGSIFVFFLAPEGRYGKQPTKKKVAAETLLAKEALDPLAF